MTEHAAAFETYGARQNFVRYVIPALFDRPMCSPFRIEPVLRPSAWGPSIPQHEPIECVFRCISCQRTLHARHDTTHDTTRLKGRTRLFTTTPKQATKVTSCNHTPRYGTVPRTRRVSHIEDTEDPKTKYTSTRSPGTCRTRKSTIRVLGVFL